MGAQKPSNMSAADRCENGWRWRAGTYRVLTLAKNSVAVIEFSTSATAAKSTGAFSLPQECVNGREAKSEAKAPTS